MANRDNEQSTSAASDSGDVELAPPPRRPPAKARATALPKSAGGGALDERGGFQLSALQQMLDAAPVNVMFADLDGVIRYMNATSRTTLKRLEQYMPIKVEDLVGNSYDIFHKDPARVRKILADPRNLPHTAVITYGPEKLSLHVTAVIDDQGTFIGVMQTWEIITERLALEQRNEDSAARLAAIDRSQAVIEFSLDGIIENANQAFLDTVGYALRDIRGQHHRIFCSEEYRSSPEYRDFWNRLKRGESISGEFQRFARGGKEVWLRATYNALLDGRGQPYKIVKYASDITKEVLVRNRMREILEKVAATVTAMNASVEELSATASQMTAAAEETASQATTVSAASEEVSRNVQSVAAGTEEMSASIREIAKNAAEAARVATSAVGVAAATNQTVNKLGESSADIGKVVKVITSIAQQTKLLALNATIEAARAGEAGKGFNVVANEVKELAKETAKATEEISARIDAIQNDTRGAVSAIGQISTIIGQISDIQTTIAGAVEEQTATTNEMSRSVSEGARGTNEIAHNITSVAKAARDTTAGASRSLQAAQVLAKLATELDQIVQLSKS